MYWNALCRRLYQNNSHRTVSHRTMICRCLLWFLNRRLPDGFDLVSTVIPPDFRVGWYIQCMMAHDNTCRNYSKLPNYPSSSSLYFSLYISGFSTFSVTADVLLRAPCHPLSTALTSGNQSPPSPESRRHIAPPETLFQSPKVPLWAPWHKELNTADHEPAPPQSLWAVWFGAKFGLFRLIDLDCLTVWESISVTFQLFDCLTRPTDRLATTLTEFDQIGWLIVLTMLTILPSCSFWSWLFDL